MRCHSRNLLVPTRALLLLLMLSATTAWSQDDWVAPSWTSVSIGVADLDQALALWAGTFGFSKLAEADGEDPELAALWRLMPSDIKRQALLGMPGARYGRLHLVEFTEPGPAVREGAQTPDLSPVNLMVYARDLPTRVKDMQASGMTFRSAEPLEFTTSDGSVRSEIHLPAHDELNIVLREQKTEDIAFSPQGFSAIAALGNAVDFATTESEFYSGILGLQVLGGSQLEGAEIESMVGVTQGVILDLRILGKPDEPLGQVELIDYQNVRSKDLYPVTVPTQLGILHVTYEIADLDALKQRLHEAGINHADRGYREVIIGNGRFIRFRSPAGMNIEVFESGQ
jgi:catechol 2,3-dioxygenase-like lactoylglutathione lyase family enzyme